MPGSSSDIASHSRICNITAVGPKRMLGLACWDLGLIDDLQGNLQFLCIPMRCAEDVARCAGVHSTHILSSERSSDARECVQGTRAGIQAQCVMERCELSRIAVPIELRAQRPTNRLLRRAMPPGWTCGHHLAFSKPATQYWVAGATSLVLRFGVNPGGRI